MSTYDLVDLTELEWYFLTCVMWYRYKVYQLGEIEKKYINILYLVVSLTSFRSKVASFNFYASWLSLDLEKLKMVPNIDFRR